MPFQIAFAVSRRSLCTWIPPFLIGATIATVTGCSGGGENGSDEVTLALTNVNTLPGLRLELRNDAGVLKSWRLAGGSSQTGPIDLALTAPDVEVLVTLAGGEELRLTPSQGLTTGTEKSCRRQSGGAKQLEVRVADLADARCTGPEWEAPDALPTVECLTPVIFSDDFAVGNQWTESFSETGGATHTVTNSATGGNLGGYRQMTHTEPSPSNIGVLHSFTGSTYDPATQGAIRHLHYAEDRIQINPPFNGAAIGTNFTAQQAGTTHFVVIGANGAFASQVWERIGLRRLLTSDFILTAPALDFTAAGAPITFGYQRGNTNNPGGVTITTTHGIDNWTVVVCH